MLNKKSFYQKMDLEIKCYKTPFNVSFAPQLLSSLLTLIGFGLQQQIMIARTAHGHKTCLERPPGGVLRTCSFQGREGGSGTHGPH